MEVLVYTLAGYARMYDRMHDRMYGNRLSRERKGSEKAYGKSFRSEKGILTARFRFH
jgi:hypothetical protein